MMIARNDSSGETSFLARWGPLIGVFVTIFVLAMSGIIYIRDIDNKIVTFRENVLNLNTPLSQRVFSLDSRVAEIARIQSDVRTMLAAIDQNGTQQTKILERDIAALKTEIASSNTRCMELNVVVGRLTQDLVETKVKLQYLIEALSPHPPARK